MSIPGRMTILISSLVFDVASVALLLEFVGLALKPTWPVAVVNWLGGISCIGWFVGFALLIDWLVFHTFPVWGPSRRALTGATLKLIASVLFNIQPWSGLSSLGYWRDSPIGCPWSNFVGIVFFHAGNCVDAIGMSPMLDRSTLLQHANLPVFGINTYMIATWFLVIADGMEYFDVESSFISTGQIIGSSLLLVASLLYTVWAAFPPAPAKTALLEPVLP